MKKNLFVLLCIAALIIGISGLVAAYDFGGGVVRISGTFPDAKNFGIDFNDARGLGHIEDVEEMFNCKIMWMDDDSSYVPETFMANILAGDPVADIQLLCRERAFFQIASEGLLTPLNDVLDEDYWEDIPLPLQARDFYYFDNNLYGFSLVDIGGWCIFWNKTLFEREGLPDPYELMENGEWTWDALREICRLATKDTDGDGYPDQFGAYFDPGIGGADQFGALLCSNNAAVISERDGKVVFTMDEPEALEAIEFLRSLLYEDKTVMLDGFYTLFGGKHAMSFTHPWWFYYVGDPDWMPDDVGILPYPAGPNGDPYEFGSYFGQNWTWAIPVTTEYDPRALVELYNALYMASYTYAIDDPEDRIIGEFASWISDRRDIEIYRDNINNLKWCPYYNKFFIPDFYPFMEGLLDEDTDPVPYIAAHKEVIQANLDAIFNQ